MKGRLRFIQGVWNKEKTKNWSLINIPRFSKKKIMLAFEFPSTKGWLLACFRNNFKENNVNRIYFVYICTHFMLTFIWKFHITLPPWTFEITYFLLNIRKECDSQESKRPRRMRHNLERILTCINCSHFSKVSPNGWWDSKQIALFTCSEQLSLDSSVHSRSSFCCSVKRFSLKQKNRNF